MKRRASKLLRLDAIEADRCRELIEKRGAEKAATLLGVCHVTTLYKAIALVPVSPLTAYTIRAHLDRGL
ncbi:MAG: hypothetical protein IT377_27830 [Polyangiaceae bacterium]|nr:hypothetical protein [Polyangiaceae bacterium]